MVEGCDGGRVRDMGSATGRVGSLGVVVGAVIGTGHGGDGSVDR